MNIRTFRSQKYLPLVMVFLLVTTTHTSSAAESVGPSVLRGISWVSMDHKEGVLDSKKTETLFGSILHNSCTWPTYWSNNFIQTSIPKSFSGEILIPRSINITKYLRKKPPRMHRGNREEVRERIFWNFFR